MDSFEILVGKLFEVEGYWLTYNYRINLSREDKKRLGKSTMPRPEIDILAYKPSINQLLIIECKSYLDSTGVSINAFRAVKKMKGPKSIRVFSDNVFKTLIVKRLITQMMTDGLLSKVPKVKIGLICGKMKPSEKGDVEELFRKNDWLLWTPQVVSKKIRALALRGHENHLATYIVKILAAVVESAI